MNTLKKKHNITIHDIAKSINISASTVSRALNNNPSISKKTKEKVWDIAKAMGYFPNLPEYMKNQKNQLFFFVDNLNKKSNHEFISTTQKHLLKNNIEVFIQLIETEKDLIEVLETTKLTWVISLLSDTILTKNVYPYFKEKNIHLTTVNQSSSSIATLSVLPDFYNGVQIATNHLLNQSVKHIVLIIDDCNSQINNDIEQGFASTLADNNYVTHQIAKTKLDHRNLIYLFEEFMNIKPFVDGFVCCDNLVACQLVSFLKSKNIRIPKDTMIVSFGNESYINYLNPGISTVEYSSKNMGKTIAQQLVKIINEGEEKSLNNKLFVEPLKLVIRGSSSTKG
ncbi:LacI family transcriptional regulator [Flavivirga sp. MEBiC05379]|uniref:LacI family transcriptional regulator n=1 Tax=Flavivirga spongiicola TaxID=421621 RepID=A0ABU7XLD4_9FLAO